MSCSGVTLSAMDPLTNSQFERFSSLIYRTAGIRLAVRKLSLLQTRIERRMKVTGIPDFDAYYRLVQSTAGRQELTWLIDEITTNETSFFRTESHFKWFTDTFLPEIRRQARSKSRRDLRIWSAACSVGAEAYTAALLIETQRMHLRDLEIAILGTDISPTSIETAAAGRFKKRLLDGVPPPWLNRYFKRVGAVASGGSDANQVHPATEYQIRDSLRSMVHFKTHNLMKPLLNSAGGSVPGRREVSFDCVFLRNVLIYFDDESKQTVLDNVIATIRPGGFLVIGPSEGIYGLRNPLAKLNTFLYEKS